MRGVSKLEPPEDVSADGQAQMSLQEAEAAYLAALPEVSPRTEFDKFDKKKLRAVMYREQRSLCVYCERRVEEGYPAPPIDHWYPLSKFRRFALHWKNLYLSCSRPGTCDSAKSDHPFRWDNDDVRLPWPVEFQYEDVVGFTSRGEIYVRSDVTLPDGIRQALNLAIVDHANGDHVQRSIVNLNDPALIRARMAAVSGERKLMEKSVENGTATGDGREKRAARLLGRGELPEFVSIRVAWLRCELGKGR